MDITFDIEEASDDETWLNLLVDGQYVGRLDYAPVTGEAWDDYEGDVLVIWQIAINDAWRGQGLTRHLLDEVRRLNPLAARLHLDAGTWPAHRVVRSWLGLPAHTELENTYAHLYDLPPVVA